MNAWSTTPIAQVDAHQADIARGTSSALEFRMLRRATLFGVLSLSLVVACSSAGEPGAQDDLGATSSELSTADAVSRAEEWATAKLHYCQAPNHARDYDSACASTCNRTSNAKWDPYRSDCSGLISWAWNLPAPGRITTQFAPFESDITHVIPASTLKEGDAVNNSDHVMLFKEWITPGTKALFIEEPGCSSATPYAHETTSTVTISGNTIHVAANGMMFTAIRYGALTAPAPAAPTSSDAGSTPPPAASEAPARAEPAPPATDPHAAPSLGPSDGGGCSMAPSRFAGGTTPGCAALAALVLGAALAGRRRSRSRAR